MSAPEPAPSASGTGAASSVAAAAPGTGSGSLPPKKVGDALKQFQQGARKQQATKTEPGTTDTPADPPTAI
eukprot:376887-Prorocentrum_lima.AAC.1